MHRARRMKQPEILDLGLPLVIADRRAQPVALGKRRAVTAESSAGITGSVHVVPRAPDRFRSCAFLLSAPQQNSETVANDLRPIAPRERVRQCRVPPRNRRHVGPTLQPGSDPRGRHWNLARFAVEARDDRRGPALVAELVTSYGSCASSWWATSCRRVEVAGELHHRPRAPRPRQHRRAGRGRRRARRAGRAPAATSSTSPGRVEIAGEVEVAAAAIALRREMLR